MGYIHKRTKQKLELERTHKDIVGVFFVLDDEGQRKPHYNAWGNQTYNMDGLPSYQKSVCQMKNIDYDKNN